MNGELSVNPGVIIDTLDLLSESLEVGSIIGEPVERDGKTVIPIYRYSMGCLGFSFQSNRSFGFGPRIKKSTRVMGHIVADESGVSWRPRFNALKMAVLLLVLALNLGLILSRKKRAGSPACQTASIS